MYTLPAEKLLEMTEVKPHEELLSEGVTGLQDVVAEWGTEGCSNHGLPCKGKLVLTDFFKGFDLFQTISTTN